MKFTIDVKDAEFVFEDRDLVIFDGRLVNKNGYLIANQDKNALEMSTNKEWSSLSDDDKFRMLQAYVENLLTAATSGSLTNCGPVTLTIDK